MTGRIVFVVLASTLLTSGCITTGPSPEQLGVGKYLQVRTLSKNLLAQFNHTTAVNCEFNLRASWAEYKAMNYLPDCSSIDLSAQLPYSFVPIKSDLFKIAQSAHFESSELCEATIKMYESGGAKYGNTTFENHCAGDSSLKSNNVKNTSSTKVTSVEERLKELKKLYDSGLITIDVYNDRQREILK